LVAGISDSPKPPPNRITFTLPLLNAAKHVWFIVTGKEKAESLASVIEKPEEGLPSARVRGCDVQFYVDKAAAAALKQAKL
jgi:6-phosphogluconolactonase